MTLKQLEAFYWAASLGSFSAAANKLNVTQSTLSKRIQELEVTLGRSLFTRTTQNISLTDSGHRILALSHQMLQMENEIVKSATGDTWIGGFYRAGISELTATTWFPAFAARLYQDNENLTLESHVDLASALSKKLLKGEIDFAILPFSSYSNHSFNSVPLSVVNFLWASSPQRIPENRRLNLKEISIHPHITMTSESQLKSAYDTWAAMHKINPKRFISCNLLNAIVALTIADVGISLLPESLVKKLSERGELTAHLCDVPLPQIEYSFCWKKDDTRLSISAMANIAVEYANYDLKDN